MSATPIKRHKSLQPFSRDHHHGLLLCWKIREGFKKNIAPERIKKYTDWFWNDHLKQHFDEEEKYIFSILSADDALVVQALSEHKKLKSLFEDNKNIVESLQTLEKELNDHIRFEERVLFKKVQEIATEKQLQLIANIHKDDLNDQWKDEFWVREKKV